MRRYTLLLVLLLGLCVSVPCTAAADSVTSAATDVDEPVADVATDDDDSAVSVATDVEPSAPDVGDVVLPDVTDAEAVEALNTLFMGTTAGISTLLAAALTLLVWAFRKAKLLGKVPKRLIPWITIFLAMLGNIVAALAQGVPWHVAVLNGLVMGSAAVGFWEAALKHVLGEGPKPPGSR